MLFRCEFAPTGYNARRPLAMIPCAALLDYHDHLGALALPGKHERAQNSNSLKLSFKFRNLAPDVVVGGRRLGRCQEGMYALQTDTQLYAELHRAGEVQDHVHLRTVTYGKKISKKIVRKRLEAVLHRAGEEQDHVHLRNINSHGAWLGIRGSRQDAGGPRKNNRHHQNNKPHRIVASSIFSGQEIRSCNQDACIQCKTNANCTEHMQSITNTAWSLTGAVR